MDEINAEWLKEHLGDDRGKKAALSKATGISTDKISKIIGGTRQVQSHEVPKIYAFFYPTGDNDMTADQVEILRLWNQLEPEEQSFLRNSAKAQIAARDHSPEESPPDDK